MSKNAASIVASIATVLCILIICGSVLRGCSNANDRYYKAQSECVTQGGSWIATSSTYTGNCVFGRGK